MWYYKKTCSLWILAESRVLLKEFEVHETELNETLAERVQEHKELEEKVCSSIHTRGQSNSTKAASNPSSDVLYFTNREILFR